MCDCLPQQVDELMRQELKNLKFAVDREAEKKAKKGKKGKVSKTLLILLENVLLDEEPEEASWCLLNFYVNNSLPQDMVFLIISFHCKMENQFLRNQKVLPVMAINL